MCQYCGILKPDERPYVIALVNRWLARPKHADTKPGSNRFAALIGAAVYKLRYGNPPNPQARLAYRMHKKRRAKLAAIATYGPTDRQDGNEREA
jgi:hypothetical protein